LPYRIVYETITRIPGAHSGETFEESAASAWMTVQQLQASDEKVRIVDPLGIEISWQELRSRAARKTN
jgi:hypothetical protein